MAEPTDKMLIAARQNAEYHNFLPLLRFEVEKMMKSVDNKAYTAINANKMTPDLAMNLWLEKSAYKNLLHRFEGKTRTSDE